MATKTLALLRGPVNGCPQEIVLHPAMAIHAGVGFSIGEECPLSRGMRGMASCAESPGHGEVYNGILRVPHRRLLVAGKAQLRLAPGEGRGPLAVASGTPAGAEWGVHDGLDQVPLPIEPVRVVTRCAGSPLHGKPTVRGKTGFRCDIMTTLAHRRQVSGQIVTLAGAVRVVAGRAHSLRDGQVRIPAGRCDDAAVTGGTQRFGRLAETGLVACMAAEAGDVLTPVSAAPPGPAIQPGPSLRATMFTPEVACSADPIHLCGRQPARVLDLLLPPTTGVGAPRSVARLASA